MWLYEYFGFILKITWLPALFFILGFAFVIFELFNPGFGVPGISGIILLILGIMFTARGLLDAIIMIILIMIIIGVILLLVLRSASKGKLSRKLILSESLKKESGYSGRDNLESFLGRKGTALTVLRPAGVGDFGNVRLDIVTDGEYIPKGSNIEIVKVEGMRIVVRKLDS